MSNIFDAPNVAVWLQFQITLEVVQQGGLWLFLIFFGGVLILLILTCTGYDGDWSSGICFRSHTEELKICHHVVRIHVIESIYRSYWEVNLNSKP